MKCSYCSQGALFKCGCLEPYMCTTHLGDHLAALRGHEYEELDIEFDQSRLLKLRLEASKSIKIIKSAKILLSSNTKSLINDIQKAYIEALDRLEKIKKDCLDILEQDKFCYSKMPFIIKIEKMELDIKIDEIDQIETEIKNYYGSVLETYIQKSEYRMIQFWNQHSESYACGVVTNDYKTLVTGGLDSTIRMWDLKKKLQKFVLLGHKRTVSCVALTADSFFIISGSDDTTVRIWDIRQKREVFIFRNHNTEILAVYYINKNSTIISGDNEGNVIINQFMKYSVIKKLNTYNLKSLILTNNQEYLIVGLYSRIEKFDLQTFDSINYMDGHEGFISTILLASDEKKLISASEDNSIIIWDLVLYQKIYQIKGLQYKINSLALTMDNQMIISGFSDNNIIIWDIKTGIQVNHISFIGVVNKILHLKSKFLLLLEDSTIGKLNINSGSYKTKMFMKQLNHNTLQLKYDSELLAFGSRNEVIIWNLEKKKYNNTLIEHLSLVKFVEISRDGKFAISCSRGFYKNLIYWNLQTGQKIAELVGHLKGVYCACFSNSGSRAASGSADFTVRTWNLRRAIQGYKFKGHSGIPLSIKYLNNKKLLVSAGTDKKVIIWNLIDKTQIASLIGHNYSILKVFVTEDDKFIISGDYFDGIRIWEIENRHQNFIFQSLKDADKWLKNSNFDTRLVNEFLKP